MMDTARLFAFGLFTGALLVGTPTAIFAQTPAEHAEHETLSYNVEVVEKLLEKADPDVAFLARIHMMQGHLNAAIYAVGKGDLVEARQHIIHPVSEIMPDIVRVLKERNLEDPTPILNNIVRLLETGKKDQIEAAMYDAIVPISDLQYSIETSKMVLDRIIADTVVLLLRTAVMEYNEAFKEDKITSIVEYHDGSAFVTEAATLILDFKYEWATRNPEAFSQLDHSLKELQTAWPSEVPPSDAVIPLTRMLSLVTVIDEQIGQIRAGS